MSHGTRPETAAIPDREAEALREIAATRGGRGSVWSSILAFFLVCLFGATVELTPSLRARTASWPRTRIVLPDAETLGAGWRKGGWSSANLQLRLAIGSINHYTDRDSVAARLLLPPIQGALVRYLSYGNGQVIVGEDGWLAYQQDWFHVVGPPFLAARTVERRQRPGWRLYPAEQPDPVEGLVRLKRQLRRLGIGLVFVPIPNKIEIYPERFARGTQPVPSRNPSTTLLFERLEARGVPVYDAVPDLVRAASGRDDLFLSGDTHWSPAGMEEVATGLARFLRRRVRLPEVAPTYFLRRPAWYQERPDLERLLGFPRLPIGSGRQRELQVEEIRWPDGSPYRVDRTPSDILLLGDSYSMVFSRLSGRGVDAGFPEHLSAALDRPILAIAENTHNELEGRTAWLRERREALASARLVIYEVADRSLSVGDWTPGRLGTGRAARQAPSSPDRHRKELP